MRRRARSLRPSAVLLALLVLAGCGSGGSGSGNAIVLVTIDTLRADRLGCGGDPLARTPRLDRLARGGTQWARAVSPVPLTLPAHATILSGRTPPGHGARDNGLYRVADDVPLAPEALARAGWRTAAFLAAYPLAARFGLARGFDAYHDVAGVRTTGSASAFVERAAHRVNADVEEWLDARGNADHTFLWIHYFDPHAPYQPPRVWVRALRGDAYRGEVAFTDDRAGRMIDRLRAEFASLRIVVTADHGESLGDHDEETHGVFVYEATTRVPLFVAGADLPAGKLAAKPVALEQIAPTLLAMAGLRPESLGFEAPVLAGIAGAPAEEAPDAPDDTPIYVESLYARLRHGWAPLRALRSDRWKVIDAPRAEIYDLHADPGERRNLAADAMAASTAPAADLLATLTAEPMTWTMPGGEPDAEVDEALASLGYVSARGAAPPDDGDLPDPKDRVAMEGLLGIATSYLEAGNPAAAERALGRAAALDPRNKEAALLRARMEAARGRLDAARAILQECQAWPPESANTLVYETAGTIELDAGNAAAAEAQFAAVVALDPLNVNARYHQGLAAYRLGRYADAAARWREALRLDPGHALAREWLPDAERRAGGEKE